MTLEKIWEYLCQNPTTFNHNKTNLTPHQGLNVGEWMVSRYRNCYYITRGNKSIKVNFKCYRCFVTGKPQITYHGAFFTFYCGFEESIIGKHFVRLDEGGSLNMKYIEKMQPLISAGVVTTYLSVWYRPFINKKVTEDGTILEVTRYGKLRRIRPTSD